MTYTIGYEKDLIALVIPNVIATETTDASLGPHQLCKRPNSKSPNAPCYPSMTMKPSCGQSKLNAVRRCPDRKVMHEYPNRVSS